MSTYKLFKHCINSLLVSTLLALLLIGNIQAEISRTVAGEITMLVGQARSTSADGVAQPLKKGDSVHVGDTIETGKKCYLKFKYTDGGTILLRPATALVIESYQDLGNGEGESVATLLKGGLRSVTGAISNDKKSNYKIKTRVATLGIRGTDFVMRLCQEGEEKGTNDCNGQGEDGLYTSTYDGGTSLVNDAGILESNAGEHAYVEAFDVLPIELEEEPRVIAIDNLPNPLDDSSSFIPGNECG